MLKLGATLRNLTDLPPLEAREYLLSSAQLADDIGFYSVFCSDHLIVPKATSSFYPYHPEGKWAFRPENNMFDALTVLACLSSITQRVKLGTSVLVLPLRHPVYTAKIIATLDVMSGGRVIFGAGAGWFREEMEAMGSPTFDQRGALTDEYLAIFKELWLKEEPDYRGRWYSVSGFSPRPRPTQQPHPPIWIGGLTPPALRRTVRYGDGWHAVGLLPEEVEDSVAKIRALAAEHGRDLTGFEYSMSSVVHVDLDAPASGEATLVRTEAGQPVITGSAKQIARLFERYSDHGLTHLSAFYQANRGATMLDRSNIALQAIAEAAIR